MSRDFEELDYQATPLGELTLRRRRMLSLGGMEVYEVKLGDAFLMSSLFHEVEVALAHCGLSELEGDSWDVVVGGLGLGYTAVAALEHREVASLLVLDALPPVIDWHRRGLIPLGGLLTGDPRCRSCWRPTSLPARVRSKGSIRSGRDDCFTPSCWTSITHRAICCTQETQLFMKRMDYVRSARICIPAASSLSGRMIRRMKIFSARSPPSSRPRAFMSSLFLIRCWKEIQRAPSMLRARTGLKK